MSFIFLGLFFTGCRKFKHEPTTIPSCELCDFAESLNGVYKGFSNGIASPIGEEFIYSVDTFEYNVQHIFLNKGQYVDSTVMFFHIWGFYQDQPANVLHDTISINNAEGYVTTPDSYNDYGDVYQLTSNTVKIYDYYSVAYVTWIDFTGYK